MGLLGDVFEGVGGALSLIPGVAGEGGKSKYERAYRLLSKIALPEFDMRDIDPVDLQVVAEFFPNFWTASVPDEVKVAHDSPEIREAQQRSLTHLERVRDEGLPLGERLAAQDMGRAMARENARVQAGILDNMRARGRAGGGTELQARQAGAQQASEYARGFGSDLAQQALMNRLRASSEAGSLGGAIRGQDIALSSSNADRINRFNLAVSQMMNQARQANALAGERAQAYNVSQKQRVADYNKMNRQATETGNVERQNRLREALFNAEMARATGRAGALGDLGRAEYAEQVANMENLKAAGQGFGGALDFAGGMGAFGDNYLELLKAQASGRQN